MKILISICTLLAIASTAIYSSFQKNNAANSNFTLVEKANWLIGAWQNNSQKMNIAETWKKKNDSTYVGQNCTVIGQGHSFRRINYHRTKEKPITL